LKSGLLEADEVQELEKAKRELNVGEGEYIVIP
jgi:hypothetical protein